MNLMSAKRTVSNRNHILKNFRNDQGASTAIYHLHRLPLLINEYWHQKKFLKPDEIDQIYL